MPAKPAALPLFYANPVALDKKIHGTLSLNGKLSFAFAAKTNAVPVNLIELPFLLPHYPIVFAQNDPATPLAILGLRDNENLFVNEWGEWQPDTYVPAYVRRYPFIFAKNDEGDKLTLCLENDKHVFEKSQRNPFFGSDGKISDMTQNAVEFCKAYQSAAEQTNIFAQSLSDAKLLVTQQASVQTADKPPRTLSGFRVLDEEAYFALPADILGDWHAKRWTGYLQAHLFSQTNWQKLFQMMEKRS